MTRVAVFLDYQNAYHGAREAFGDPSRDAPTMGHVNPQRLGLLLKQLGEDFDPNRELTAVTVYRGEPGARSHPKLQSAFARQVSVWRSQPLVTVKTRPLRYQPIEWSMNKPIKWRAEEKGIDVLMALDIALGARDDLYDAAIVVSGDTDLIPALEYALGVGKRIETAMWWDREYRHRQLKLPGSQRRLWNHRLDRQRFEYVRDGTDYTIAT